MISLTGYDIEEKIHESRNSIIYRASRTKDALPVIIKQLNREFPTAEQLASFRREYDMALRFGGSRIVNVISLENYRNTLAMVLEDFGGLSLSVHLNAQPLGTNTFLSLALKMTQALEQAHSQHIIHKDVNPSNFIWNNATGQLKITDFSLSTELSREASELKNVETIEGTLAYVSPEQTGRINKSVDYRTDFYGLGISFYQMLTGRLPFASDDTMEAIHSHIARTPRKPSDYNPDIPPVLSEIVMKLIAKSAEDRYQSTSGLKYDLLQCQEQLELTGTVSPFDIAKTDISDWFHIPQKLYGRSLELNETEETFKRVAIEGAKELLLVTGSSGVGKSSLIHELQKQISEENGFFISGKFDRLKRDIPYSSLIQAFKQLVQQLLTEKEEKVTATRNKLLSTLGTNGSVIIDVIPEVELIIGKQPKVNQLPPEQSRLRFEYSFQSFIGCIANAEHPLVLFLDDLQWVDTSSLQLIGAIARDSDINHLLIIGAYRDNELSKGHPLHITIGELEQVIKVNSIQLKPLSISNVTQLISETLFLNNKQSLVNRKKETQSLAELCYNKTFGNPFFLIQFLEMLHRSNAISFNYGESCWEWDIDKINEMKVTENVVDLMISKIHELPPETQNLLSLAACIGAQFDLKILSLVNKSELAKTATNLWPGLLIELIEPIDSSYKYAGVGGNIGEENSYQVIPSYRFVHDRIQQAAYDLIGEQQRHAIHWDIGNLILESYSQEETNDKIFDLIDHLNRGKVYAVDQREKEKLARLNYKAGIKANSSAAYKASSHYLKESIVLLGEDPWRRSRDFVLDIYTLAAEASYLTGDYKQTEYLTKQVLSHTSDIAEQASIYEIQILSFIAQNRLDEANKLGIKILKPLGVSIHNNPSKRELIASYFKVKLKLIGKSTDSLFELPPMRDEKILHCSRILSHIATSSIYNTAYLGGMGVFKQMDLTLHYGSPPSSPYMYAAYGGILCAFGKFDRGLDFGLLGLKLARQTAANEFYTRSVFVYHSQISHWKNHISESPSHLLTAYKTGVENGDPEFASYSLAWYCLYQFLLGKDLNQLLNDELKPHFNAVEKLHVDTATYGLGILTEYVNNLVTAPANPCVLQGEAYDENRMLPVHKQAQDRLILCVLYWQKLMISYLVEDYDLAEESGQRCKKFMKNVSALVLVPSIYFYHSLVRLALLHRSGIRGKNSVLRQIKRGQKLLKKWAQHCPMNYEHKYLLVEAEIEKVNRNYEQAERFYVRAIDGAKKNNYIQEEALANELFAKYWLDRGNEEKAKSKIKKAHHLYQIWGAKTKTKHMENRYARLLAEEDNSEYIAMGGASIHDSMMTTTKITESLDLESIMRATQAISGEIQLRPLLQKLMSIAIKNAGARKALLILKDNDEYKIFVRAFVTTTEDMSFDSTPIEASDELPHSLINYTLRTQETTVLEDATNQGAFTQDPYIKQQNCKSILCAPIARQKELMGILYMENNQTTKVFTPERLKVIHVLLSQATISFENATLYDDLSRSEEKYRTILESIEDGYFESELSGRYVFVNDSLSKMFGYSEKEFLGMTYKDVSSVRSSEEIRLATKHVYETGIACKRLECEGIRKDGSIFVCEISMSVVKDSEGNPAGFRGITRDISDRKEKEIAETKRKAAEIAEKTKTEFFANMSHEIRTPMNAIIGFSHLALEENSDAQRDYLKKITSASQSLLGIINDVLDFSKIEAGKLTMEQKPFELEQVVARLNDMFSLEISKNRLEMRVTIEKDVPDTLVGDPLRLSQILINLVGNAIKFTKEGAIEISISRLSNESGQHSDQDPTLKFVVKDSGIGMTAAQQEDLFKPFSQGDSSTTRKYGGTGLGLAISKQLVEMMGGKIWAESELGLGSSFTFTSQYRLPNQGETPRVALRDYDESQIHRLHGMRILLVEDDETNQQVATGLLQSKDIKVRIANNGKEAINMLRQQDEYDLVLMDIQMAEMDGYEATRLLRQKTEFDNLPIIAMTAHAMAEEKTKCLEAGMNDHLSKPIDPSALFSVLLHWAPKKIQSSPRSNKDFSSGAQSNNAALPNTLAELNIASGINKIGGNELVYCKMLSDFKKRHIRMSDTLSIPKSQSDLDILAQYIHKLKGAVGNIGAENLHGLCLELEALIKSENQADVGRQLNLIQASLNKLFSSITQVEELIQKTAGITENNIGALAPKELTQKINELDTLLKEARPDSEYLFDAIKGQVISLGFEQESLSLSEKIEALDFQEARDILKPLSASITKRFNIQ